MHQLPFDHLPYLERVKIQTEILLPLFRRMREELGNERACAMLRDAVQEYSTKFGRDIADSSNGTPIEKLRTVMPVFAAGDAIHVEPLEESPDEMKVQRREVQVRGVLP